MGFIGRFELKVPDILQILSLTKKTGRLRLSRLGNTGEVLFKGGKIIYAVSDSHRTTLGNILMREQQISEKALMAALELQHMSTDNKRLGAILIEKGLITPQVLHQAVRSQIEQVITEFLSWEEGFFRFDMMDVGDDDGVNLDTTDFLAKKGINLESLLLEGARRLDEERRGAEEASATESSAPAPPRDLPDEARRPDPRVEDSAASTAADAAAAPPPEAAPVGNSNERRESMRVAWLIPEPSPAALIIDETSGDHAGDRMEVEQITEPPSPSPPFVVDDTPAAAGVDHHAEAAAPASPVPEATSIESPAPHTPPMPTDVGTPAGLSAARAEREPAAHEVSLPNIDDEIALSSPVSPWVLIMNFAPEVVSRGVLLSVRKEGFTAFDQFGLADGTDLEDERLGQIRIPLNEPSVFGVIANRRTTYRGKIGGGKWTDYFLNRLGGQRVVEALVIPIVVAGRVVAIFYGDNAGTGKSFGDVERLEALIRQTFSTVESSLLEKQKKTKSRR